MGTNQNSALIYEGKSLLRPDVEIVVVATGFNYTANSKLGSDFVQVWVMNKNIAPLISLIEDTRAICGSCPLANNGCYVNVSQAPNQIWKAYKNNKYKYISEYQLDLLKAKKLRLTAYGDVGAVPYEPIDRLTSVAKVTLGYTHQWRLEHMQRYRGMLMASVESIKAANLAQNMGWKTFRVGYGETEIDNEVICTNSINKSVQCSSCLLCTGKDTNVVIQPHGTHKKKVERILDNVR